MAIVLLSFCLLSVLLLIGKFLRVKIKLLQLLYLPSSVIGGLIGLGLVYVIKIFYIGDEIALSQGTINAGFANIFDNVVAEWASLPGLLINLVFAGLFLGVRLPSLRKIWNVGGPQFIYGQVVAWGQYIVGIGMVLFFLKPFFNVPDQFGVIVPVGFEGGHGTAGGLSKTFEKFDWAVGKDFGLTAATVGMIAGIIIGMALVNWATRNGYVSQLKGFNDQSEGEQKGIYETREERPVAGWQTVHSDSVDSLAFHISFVGVAVFIGYLIKKCFVALNFIAPIWLQKLDILNSFPLFPLCMVGGLIVQVIISYMKQQQLLDHNLMQRISGAALDFLVVAAVATIKIDAISESIVPFVLICGAGILWNIFCVLFVSRMILPNYWFERSIAEMGQSMGVTATGLLLLRTVDPNSETDAPAAFGYKQLLHEPFMGGGLWTSTAIPLVFVYGGMAVFLTSLIAMGFFLLLWFFLRKTWQES
ncbi:sodium/glutamate symporter [Lentisphaerota bacterium WC36G]|nr:sodium:glutamate symporter [Lentisphaerae bacterium WC36]